jgi:hypothetical protein
MARMLTQVGPREFLVNGHLPFTVELTKGCSIGCDYCAANAGPLRRIARFTEANARLFRDILRTIAEFFGERADIGFLYYATEPLDNSDYERYQQIFREELGRLPPTTTAAWWRKPERARRILQMGRDSNGWNNRFFSLANFIPAGLDSEARDANQVNGGRRNCPAPGGTVLGAG